MAKEQATIERSKNGQEEGWNTEGGNLPPMVILNVGGVLKGQISQVDLNTKTEGKGKARQERTRYFYRVVLAAPVEGTDGKTKKDVRYAAGTLVTLPGSGSLDNLFGHAALKVQGKTLEPESEIKDVADYQQLVGLLIEVTRNDDDKMKTGAWAGKTVKTFTLRWKKS